MVYVATPDRNGSSDLDGDSDLNSSTNLTSSPSPPAQAVAGRLRSHLSLVTLKICLALLAVGYAAAGWVLLRAAVGALY